MTLTEPRIETLSGTRSVRYALAIAAGMCMLSAPQRPAAGQDEAAQPAVVAARVTAFSGDGSVTLAGDPVSAKGKEEFLDAGFWLDFSVRLRDGASGDRPAQAVLSMSAIRTVIILDSAAVEIKQFKDFDAGISVFPGGQTSGIVDIYQQGELGAKILVIVPGAVAVLSGAAVRVAAVEGGVEIALGGGTATIYSGELPADGIAALTNGVALDASGDNALVVGSDGTLSPPRPAEGVPQSMTGRRQSVIQRSLVPDMVKVSEAVGEGDIEPPTRGTRVAAASVAPPLQIPELVPRGSTATQVISGAQGQGATFVQSIASAFLGRGNVGLALVGVRLLDTRIIGGAGGSRAPLSINPQTRNRFTVGRR